MNNFLIVTLADNLSEYREIAYKYGVGFEINDFYDPELLEDDEKLEVVINLYKEKGIPENSTMHGVFYDTILFSYEPAIRAFAKRRMRQSMEIGRRLGIKGVVFHTNYIPALAGKEYDERAIRYTADYIEELLKDFPDVEIYLENMFDDSAYILTSVAEQLKLYSNFGICLDYAHMCVYGTDKHRFLEDVLPFVKHVHVNDNDLKRDLHLAIGDGRIDWDEFKHYYMKYFQKDTVLIETTKPENQIRSLEYLKDHSFIL